MLADRDPGKVPDLQSAAVQAVRPAQVPDSVQEQESASELALVIASYDL